jgi:hypothetical protein
MVRYYRGAIVVIRLAACAVTVRAQDDPLRLGFACSQAAGLTFRWTLQNVAAKPTAAVIGAILGQWYLPGRLELTVRRASAPDVVLRYFDPAAPGVVGGRIDPWLIALPSGASYSVAVPAHNLRLTPNLEEEPFSTPADLQLHLTTQEMGRTSPDLQSLIHVWVGTLTSKWIHFPGDCGPDE